MVVQPFVPSADGVLERIITADDLRMTAQVLFEVPSAMQRRALATAVQNGEVQFNMRSRLARVGFNAVSHPDSVESGKGVIALAVDIMPFSHDYIPAQVGWQSLVPSGMKTGQLAPEYPAFMLSASDIEQEMRRGVIRLPEGSYLTSRGDIFLKLHLVEHVPNPALVNEEYLRLVLSHLPRSEIIKLQPSMDVERIVVPAQKGIITHTVVRWGPYELVVQQQQPNGVLHSSARHGRPYSPPLFFVELIGNGRDVGADYVVANLFRTAPPAKHSVAVPDISSILNRDRVGTAHLLRRDRQEKSLWTDFPAESLDAVLSSQLPGARATLYLRRFPQGDSMDVLAYAARSGKLEQILFSEFPEGAFGFSAADFERTVGLTAKGVRVCWQHPDYLQPLIFHRVAFMPEADREEFDRAYASGSIAAAFGSSMIVDRNLSNVREAFDGIRRFFGGGGYLMNGGGPAMMTDFSRLGRDVGLKVGTINLVKPGEQQAADVDFLYPFSVSSINIRQANLLDAAGVYIFFNGGVGLLSEFGEVLTKAKLEMNAKPILVVGSSDNLLPAVSRALESGLRQGTIPGYVLQNLHVLERGAQVYDTLLQHFSFQRQ